MLLGQDQFNQSAVVVLGDKTSDNISPGDDISAVIGELISLLNSPWYITWYEGQVVTNLSPSIGENIRVAEGGDDIFSTLLESSDQGPIVLDELPEVWAIFLAWLLNTTSILKVLKISNPDQPSVEEEVRSVGQSRRKISLTQANEDDTEDAVLDERVSTNNEIQKGQEDRNVD